ncbi:histidine kinase [Methylobacterium sp. NEAU 140]|uniref:histidine kinase n=1 Tax=Methylobacterium sp. NEAU 140 TaxID=3064945 RepID=UPI00273613C5|nr:histidine kinase [Methylobacterium sp. NEAU 140]MDP4021878.1 histidine kinase [Methylobacterium sp. NEAU 140]
MADYYPLLARALDALPDRSPALRRAVYDRARNALISQLRSLEPPLSEDDIDLERRALDAAIDRLEVDHGGVPAPANDAASPAADPAAPPPAVPEPPEPEPPAAGPAVSATPVPAPPVSEPSLPEPAPPEPPAPGAQPSEPVGPALPAAAAPVFIPASPAPEPEPREAAIAIAPRRPRSAAAPSAPETGEPEPAEPAETAAETVPAESGNGRQRPRIAVVPPRAGRSRMLRNGVVGVALAAVIGAIAVVAFLLRDRPQALPPVGAETAGTQQSDNGDAKFNDRVGGDAAPAAAPRQTAPPPPRTDAAQPGIAVAQRAVLLEESTSSDSTQPTTTPGRVTWRLDAVNGEQGQPLQTVVAATVTYPEAGLTLVMKIQRNLDATLPASHTVSLAFSQSGPEGASRVVQDVGLLQAKDEENGRGSPVSGLPVRVRENLFLIGLSSLPSDVERNTDLLLRRPWFEIAVRYASGKRAVLVFEKGTSGTQVLQSAFDAWR